MSDWTLYGTPASLFTGKARGYLRWKGVDFEEVPCTPEVMKETVLPAIGWPVMPVVRAPDGTMVQDTADIIDAVEAAVPTPSVMPDGPLQRFVSQLLQLFADEWLVLPAMHYRWNYNEDWIFGEFGRAAFPDRTPEDQYAAGKSLGERFRGFVPVLGINADTIPAIEASYEAFLAEFSAHLAVHPYVFGARPSFADFALLGPLYAHLYRDPASGEIMKRLAPAVADWTERTHAGGAPQDGDLIGGDEVPETLLPLLTRHLSEHLPVLLETEKRVATWAETAEPGAPVPRGFDPVGFTVEGQSGTQMARSFSLFRLQAALDVLAGMDPAAQVRAHDLLADVGGNALVGYQLTNRLARRNYRLCLA